MFLRDFRKQDARELTSVLNDPGVSRFMTYVTPVEEKRVEEWFLDLCSDPFCLVSVIESDGRAVGCVRVERFHGKQKHVGKISIWIGSAYQGNNIGSEALALAIRKCKSSGFKRLEAEVLENNSRALHFYEKAGFVREGFLRKRVSFGDGFLGVVVLGLLL